MSFSHGSEGGTLALPSPTHAHHMDVTSAVRTLRRSMSRSPSTKLFSRSASNNSDSSNSQQQSPQSPCRRFALTPPRRTSSSAFAQTAPPNALSQQTSTSQQSNFTPLRPTGRLSLRSAKSAKLATPSRPLSRLRASPKSPLRRALNTTTDLGNSSLSAIFSSSTTTGQENVAAAARSPPRRRNLDKPTRHSLHLDVSGASQHAFLKALDANKSPSMNSTGALKRSDATMNLDQPDQGSPMAKRRSLHGFSSLAQTTDVVSSSPKTIPAAPSFEIHEDPSSEYELATAAGSSFSDLLPSSPATGSHLPQRSSSLRKTTLQQRYGDKSSLSRRSGERHLAQMAPDAASPARSRPRLSSDHFLPPQVPRDSPFSSRIPLPSASVHPLETSKPHPLSKTLTTSSSGGNLEEEQPALYAAAKPIETVKPHPFSKSLPVGATRPTARPLHDHTKAVATPNGSGQLWLNAFNSTGLISKVNRNFEEEAEKKMVPPDTPCKKHSNPFATYPPKFSSAMKKKDNNRRSFGGIPSTPFSSTPGQAPDTFGKPGKGLAIFQRGSALRSSRRGSILGLDDDEDRKLLSETSEAPNVVETDVPPTPTRNTLTPSGSNLSQQSLESPSANRTQAAPTSAVRPPISRESTGKSMLGTSEISADSFNETSNGDIVSVPAALGQPSIHKMMPPSSFGRSRAKHGSRTPTPSLPAIQIPDASRTMIAKMTSTNAASPVDGRRTPQTPQEGYLPWDASRLSISQTSNGFNGDVMPPPMTPTGARDLRSSTSVFVTPANVRTQNLDIDSSLTGRFDKVEYIGKGEFSSVYRVAVTNHRQNALDALSGTPQLAASQNLGRESIFAVKKSRHPFTGPKDRDVKLREVRILQALTHAEHVVRYIDSWEHSSHLYIQTEFCEEGTLDKFLGNVGRGGRLDDFRIFKMLQDLCLGLKEIHDAGFMHLDMKPANILVTFEGALKIGDFGLAQAIITSAHGVDVEGDREYMAPEMLKGNVGGSADIFSLGLITLEAAANVVLPDNGPTWIALRSGDLSEVPSLTWAPSLEGGRDGAGTTDSGFSDELGAASAYDNGDLFGSYKRSELQKAPEFMINPAHSSSLDSVVKWMTAQEPSQRPLADQVLELEGLRWVAAHRSAPATVYEGSWGPAEAVPVSIMVDSDSEMLDV